MAVLTKEGLSAQLLLRRLNQTTFSHIGRTCFLKSSRPIQCLLRNPADLVKKLADLDFYTIADFLTAIENIVLHA